MIIFGEDDPIYYEGEMKWFKVTDKYYWQIGFSDISINGVKQNFCMMEECKLAIDTGTSLITGPSADVVLLLRMINLNSKCDNYD